jgi:hypothetical protein
MIWFRRSRRNPVTLNEQPDAIAALTAAIGPSLGYHISECSHGGYIVIVDGAVHCARTTLPEAITAMGEVAANRYGKSATSPERAAVVTPRGDPSRVEDDPALDHAADVAGPYGPRPATRRQSDGRLDRTMEHLRRTAQVALLVLVIGGTAMWRGAS